MKSAKTAILIILGVLLIAFIIGCFILMFTIPLKAAYEVTEQTQKMKAAWSAGNVCQGTAVKVSDQTSAFDRIFFKTTIYGVEWHYTVDGQEYTSPSYRFSGKLFDDLDEDGDGTCEVDVHYDPNDPQTSIVRGVLTGNRKMLVDE